MKADSVTSPAGLRPAVPVWRPAFQAAGDPRIPAEPRFRTTARRDFGSSSPAPSAGCPDRAPHVVPRVPPRGVYGLERRSPDRHRGAPHRARRDFHTRGGPFLRVHPNEPDVPYGVPCRRMASRRPRAFGPRCRSGDRRSKPPVIPEHLRNRASELRRGGTSGAHRPHRPRVALTAPRTSYLPSPLAVRTAWNAGLQTGTAVLRTAHSATSTRGVVLSSAFTRPNRMLLYGVPCRRMASCRPRAFGPRCRSGDRRSKPPVIPEYLRNRASELRRGGTSGGHRPHRPRPTLTGQSSCFGASTSTVTMSASWYC